MRSPESTATVRRRYRCVASIYDWANLEGLLYADARARAIELLDLRPRARVLDVACGTGANFALIEQRVGPAGDLVVIPRPLLDVLLARLLSARDALATIGQLSDEQMDSVPPAGEMKFADGERTLEQIIASLLKHQRHKVDALAAALS